MPPDAAVADKMSLLVKYRQPRDRHVALPAVRRRSSELEIPEWQVGIEYLTVLAPDLSVRFQVGHFPASLADLGARRRRVSKAFGELLADETMLRVGLPVQVEGELDERAKALLALP